MEKKLNTSNTSLLISKYLKNVTSLNFYMKRLSILLIFFAMSIFLSCRKYLEIKSPQDKVLQSDAFRTNENVNAAILNIYAAMRNGDAGPYLIPKKLGMAGDELTSYRDGLNPLYTNTYESNNSDIDFFWVAAYNYIFQANSIIEGCAKSNALTPSVKNEVTAEAYFIRAYWHFFLYNLYGDIPVITTTNYLTNSNVKRQSKSLVFSQIESDLKMSISGLNDHYVDATALVESAERIRPNKFTAIALLARVYLYNQEYKNAEDQASIVINNTNLYLLLEDLNSVFLANSKEAIWQLKGTTPSDYLNTPEGYGFILVGSPIANQQESISPQLLSVFDDLDSRKSLWIGTFTDTEVTPNIDYHFSYKYKLRDGTDPLEYSMIFRLAEQFLIRAEAEVAQGNVVGGIQDVDIIKKRAGLPLIADTNPNVSSKDLLDEIFKERQRELFCEQGHRWFDLKRSGRIDLVMPDVSVAKGGIWTSSKQLFPIPLTEISNNPNMVQNPGYN